MRKPPSWALVPNTSGIHSLPITTSATKKSVSMQVVSFAKKKQHQGIVWSKKTAVGIQWEKNINPLEFE